MFVRSYRLFARLLFSLFLGTFLVGCANIWIPPEGAQRPQMTPTGVGASAGAVLGAGLGTIVGSSTGNAGEGFVVGSLAGAAAGGAIGNQFEVHEQQLISTEEELTRQREMIQNQQRDINELKRQLDDQFARNNRPSLADRSYRFDRYSGNPQAKPLADFDSPRGVQDEMPSRSLQARPELRAPVRQLPPVRQSRSGDDFSQILKPRDTVPSDIAPMAKAGTVKKPVQVVRQAEPELFEEEPESEVKPIEIDVEPLDDIEAEAERIAAEIGRSKSVPAGAAISLGDEASDTLAAADESRGRLSVDNPQCTQAQQEAMKARNAVSDADKLFYYRRALRLCPERASYHLEIGRVYSSIGRLEDAKFEFRRALDLDPNNDEATKELSLLSTN